MVRRCGRVVMVAMGGRLHEIRNVLGVAVLVGWMRCRVVRCRTRLCGVMIGSMAVIRSFAVVLRYAVVPGGAVVLSDRMMMQRKVQPDPKRPNARRDPQGQHEGRNKTNR